MEIKNEQHKELLNEAREKLEQIVDSGEYCRLVMCVESSGSSVFLEEMYEPEGEEESEEEK